MASEQIGNFPCRFNIPDKQMKAVDPAFNVHKLLFFSETSQEFKTRLFHLEQGIIGSDKDRCFVFAA